MAEMIIMLRRDPETGKQNILVKLNSDADTLPLEHEQMHRTLVEKLIGRGMNPDELGQIIVEREGSGQIAEGPIASPPEERRAVGQGQ